MNNLEKMNNLGITRVSKEHSGISIGEALSDDEMKSFDAYSICHSWSIAEVERQVNEAIADHYFPVGGITFDGKEFYQAVFKNINTPCC